MLNDLERLFAESYRAGFIRNSNQGAKDVARNDVHLKTTVAGLLARLDADAPKRVYAVGDVYPTKGNKQVTVKSVTSGLRGYATVENRVSGDVYLVNAEGKAQGLEPELDLA